MDVPSAVLPPMQSPDLLGSYVRGSMVPGAQVLQQQDIQRGALSLDQMRLVLQNQRALQGLAGNLLSGSNPSPDTQPAGAQNAGTPTGGIQNRPQAAVSSPRQANVEPGYQAGDYSIPSVSTPALDARHMAAVGLLGGGQLLDSLQKTQQLQQEQRQSAIAQAQLKAEGPLNVFDSVARSPSPARMAMNNPSLMALWPNAARQMGLDPVADFNDANVARAALFGGNQVRAAVGLPLTAMPQQLQTTRGPLGSIYQTEPLTNKITQVKPEEELKPVIGKDGQPVLLPSSQAGGYRPFNESLFAADSLTDQAKELGYQRFLATGDLPPTGRGGAAQQAATLNYIAQRAQAEGNSAAAIAARGQAFKAQQAVLNDFTSGQTSKTLNGINTAVAHMDSLQPLIDALNGSDPRLLNQVSNAFKAQTGSPAPTNYAALKEFVGGEVAKAVLPGGGGEAERQALTAPLNAANSPTQLKQAVQTIQTALAGKTEALRNQWDIGTNGSQGSFDRFLLPATKKALQSPTQGAPPQTNAQGWPLHQDKNGVKAYVSPDGKQYQVVQ